MAPVAPAGAAPVETAAGHGAAPGRSAATRATTRRSRRCCGSNDGAIRWIEDGELLTLYPEPGMDPVVVCDAAYHRIVDMGIDADYVSGGG